MINYYFKIRIDLSVSILIDLFSWKINLNAIFLNYFKKYVSLWVDLTIVIFLVYLIYLEKNFGNQIKLGQSLFIEKMMTVFIFQNNVIVCLIFYVSLIFCQFNSL